VISIERILLSAYKERGKKIFGISDFCFELPSLFVENRAILVSRAVREPPLQ
jgi:hypothetical protein